MNKIQPEEYEIRWERVEVQYMDEDITPQVPGHACTRLSNVCMCELIYFFIELWSNGMIDYP